MPDVDAILARFVADPDPALLADGRVGPALARLARGQASIVAALDPHLDDPLLRALAGLAEPPEESELGRRVLATVAAVEGGATVDAGLAAELEDAARAAASDGDPSWWPLAAQVHVASSVEREQSARMQLSVQELPYVFPGELGPIQVEVLAVGPRVMPALHVDWARKLTKLTADALVLDCRSLGLWFWPVLRSLPIDRLTRPVAKLGRARRLPPGGKGLAAAYAFRVGVPWEPLLRDATPADELLAAVAIIGERPA